MNTLPGRILVTGGGTGLGRAIATACRNAGAEVVLCGRRESVLQETAESIGASFHACDLNEPLALEGIGPFDGVVHAAGARLHAGVADWSPEQGERLWRLHVDALARMAQRMSKDSGGSILALASSLAIRPVVGSAAYSATKAAQLSLVRSLALELAPMKIRVNALVLGVVPTDMTRSQPAGEPDPHLDRLASLHPLGLGTPENVASAALALLANPWITGAELAVDGGLSLA
ncbi:MAG: SDR family oxidoreductase [Myxococcota bacterium]|nr:SDR family oxidoreductase [Myxococcota bacterium]